MTVFADLSTAQFSLQYNVSAYILKPVNTRKIEQITNILRDLSASAQNVKIFRKLIHDEAVRREFFKKHTGSTLISYISYIRLNQACRLLKNTQLTVAEIAQMVGYSNSNYFCRVLKYS